MIISACGRTLSIGYYYYYYSIIVIVAVHVIIIIIINIIVVVDDDSFRVYGTVMQPPPLPPRCSRHLRLAVGLVGRAGHHHGLLEALYAPLDAAAHVLVHHIGTPVPAEGENRGPTG